MCHVNQQRRKLLATPDVATRRKRSDGVAMIGLFTRDQMPALILALFHEILPRELDRRFRRLGPTRNQIDLFYPLRRVLNQQIRQLFRRFGRQKAGVRKSQLVQLRLDRLGNFNVPMPKAGHCRAAGGIQILLARSIVQIAPLTGHGDGGFDFRVAGKNMAHDISLLNIRTMRQILRYESKNSMLQ